MAFPPKSPTDLNPDPVFASLELISMLATKMGLEEAEAQEIIDTLAEAKAGLEEAKAMEEEFKAFDEVAKQLAPKLSQQGKLNLMQLSIETAVQRTGPRMKAMDKFYYIAEKYAKDDPAIAKMCEMYQNGDKVLYGQLNDIHAQLQDTMAGKVTPLLREAEDWRRRRQKMRRLRRRKRRRSKQISLRTWRILLTNWSKSPLAIRS